MRWFRQLLNILKDTFKGIFRYFGMSAASVASIGAMLTLFGVVLLLVLNINNAVYSLGQELDKVVIWIQDGSKAEDVNQLIGELSKDSRVRSVQYTSKERAIEKFRDQLADKGYLMDSVSSDVLPASLTVSLNDAKAASDIAEQVQGKPVVERTDYHYELIQKMQDYEKSIKYVGAAVVIVLLFVSVLIIHNTILITVSNRSHEIEIMKYIGATDSYIKSPFLLEGIIFGIIGAVAAFFLVTGVYSYYYGSHNVDFTMLLERGLVEPQIIKRHLLVIFVCIGSGIGFLGSLVSTERHLNV
ncbi:permease-like cell division protein FtsX [Peptoniphilus equinus]|uniref:Cell division protein FtsX n=1 Tax=Peptoniphilus equinus TaxID=3016343 RepID=A0ABY7QSS0_9FIRM|nr:permease-like cell division protein FtsX [Peptoniphilus equinus]WBW49511.1 permease-like cell division protein FtsX [Peptoniphilus equinus]